MTTFKKTIRKIYNVGKNLWYNFKNKISDKTTVDHCRETFSNIILQDTDDVLYAEIDTLKNGSSIICTCKLLPKSHGFTIDLCTMDDNITLRVSVLIKKNLIGRNFQVNGYWGSEETDTELPFHLQADINYQIEIFTLNEAFLIALNGFHIARYKHHLPYENVNQITIHGSIRDVRVAQDILNEYPMRLDKTLHIGRLVNYVKMQLNSEIKHENRLSEVKTKSQIEGKVKEGNNSKFVTSYKNNGNVKENIKKKSAEERILTVPNKDTEPRKSNTVRRSKEINVQEIVEDDDDEEEFSEEDDNDIFDRECFKSTEANGHYLPLPFYGTFKKGTFKVFYRLLIKGRVHQRPQQLEVNLQNGIQVWPPPIRILTIKILFIHVELLSNFPNNNNNLMSQETSARRNMNTIRNTNTNINTKDDCRDNDCKLELPANVAHGLQPNSFFHIEILRKSKYFEIFINNVLTKKTPYTKNPKLADTVLINGDFKLYDIQIISD